MKKSHHFTLLEIAIVVAIIGLIAGLTVQNFIGTSDTIKKDLTEASIKMISDSLKHYKVRNGKYPTTDEGLEVLVQGKESAILEELPLDPWSRPFYYEYPGSRDKAFDIYSYGEDGQSGGEGINEDLYN